MGALIDFEQIARQRKADNFTDRIRARYHANHLRLVDVLAEADANDPTEDGREGDDDATT